MDRVDKRLIRESEKGLIWWYPFKNGSRILYIGNESDAVYEFLEAFNKNIRCIRRNEISGLADINERFDYIVCIEIIEYILDIQDTLNDCKRLLLPKGVMLVGTHNRLGIRYFCGDWDPYTFRNFDGIENYIHAGHDFSSRKGRAYSMSEWRNMLDYAGFENIRFYSVFPRLHHPAMILAEDFIPNEDLSNRIFPEYYHRESVFIEEEGLYSSLVDNNMLHVMANAYLIECSAGTEMSDVSQVTLSLDRGRKDAMLTVLRKGKSVQKIAAYDEGKERLKELDRHSRELRSAGVATVDGRYMDGCYEMPYIEAQTAQVYFKELLRKDKALFLREFDRFKGEILKAHENRNSVVPKVYPDMVPLNCFVIDGQFVFFDQEFADYSYPVDMVIWRMIATFYFGNLEIHQLFPMSDLLERYGLEQETDKWRVMEEEFLSKLRSEDVLNKYYGKYRRRSECVEDNRKRMIRSAWENRKIFSDIFCDADACRLIIFGTGSYANQFINQYGEKVNIDAVVDNDNSRWGILWNGYTVRPPSYIKSYPDEDCKVMICIKSYGQIIHQLEDMGFTHYSVFDPNIKYRVGDAHQTPYHLGYCAGAFDMFHIGHLNLLRRAKERCDHLIVGVMSDERMYDLKKKYPVIPCKERMQVVAGCRYVDQVEELPADRAGIMDVWNRFHFDCMFSGDDHADDPGWLAERERLREHGSDIVFVSYTKETSSSAIREKMKKDADKVNPDDSRLLTDKNHRWIYTYDYAPDSVWEEWRLETGAPAWIEDEADAVAERVLANAAAEPGTDPDMDSYRGASDGDGSGLSCYILLADSHFAYNGTWDDTVASMRALCERIRIKGIIHLGDLTDGLLPLYKTKQIEDKVMSDMKSLGIPVHVVPGNHDYNYFRGNTEIRYPETPRYYVDDKGQKLRMCFIDSFDPKAESRYGFTEDCIAWLDETLSMMPEGYRAIVFSHLPPLVRLQAWTADIRNRIRLIEVLDKYSEKIMAFINGHNHCDQLFNDLKNGQFPIISINCAKCEYFLEHKPEGAEVPFRRLGDRSQESFDVMQVDIDKNEIYFTRFGAGRDRTVKNHRAYRL